MDIVGDELLQMSVSRPRFCWWMGLDKVNFDIPRPLNQLINFGATKTTTTASEKITIR
jgi:hypothetical protein